MNLLTSLTRNVILTWLLGACGLLPSGIAHALSLQSRPYVDEPKPERATHMPLGFTLLKARLYLEGFYQEGTGQMHTLLNAEGLIPASQPYFAPPYDYYGSETVNAVPANMVDWVLVEVRDLQSTSTVRARKAALLMADGMLYDANGTEGVVFDALDPGDYAIVVYHKSHLGVMSNFPVTLSGDPAVYNFTSSPTQAAGNDQLKQKGNVYLLFSGDFDGNGLINNLDFNLWQQSSAAINQYLSIDSDGNGLVNNIDYNLWTGNRSKIGDQTIQR